ncbi:MAG: PaaI family thioesterase [Pseudomonadota bacterium]
MMQTFGARLTRIEPGAVTIEAEVADGLRQQQGFGHAALTFGLGDSAAGYAALSLMAAADEVLTVEMKINLLAPTKGTLRAEGRVIRPGKRLIVVSSTVWSGTTQVALLQGTMIPVAVGGGDRSAIAPAP